MTDGIIPQFPLRVCSFLQQQFTYKRLPCARQRASPWRYKGDPDYLLPALIELRWWLAMHSTLNSQISSVIS